MKKNILTFFVIIFGLSAYANSDYFYWNSYPNNIINNGRMLTNGNIITKNSLLNRYNKINTNPFSFFRPKNNVAKNIINGLKNTNDYEYLLSGMEQNVFGNTYSDTDIDSRLDAIEEKVFGASQTGDINLRINRLKRAFSAKNIDNDVSNNNFRSFFTQGYPTSIPADSSYYSFLDGFGNIP